MRWWGWFVAGLSAIALFTMVNAPSVPAAAPPIRWQVDHPRHPAVAGARMTGWVATKTPARVIVTLDDEVVAAELADQPRHDVAVAHGVEVDVGFDIALDHLGFGTHPLCVRAETRRRSIDLGCRLRTVIPERTEQRGRKLVVNAAGDVYTNATWFTNDGRVDFAPLLDGIRGLFRRDDLSIVNMDCTPSELGSRVWKRFNLRCPVGSLAELAREGVDVVSQANNHAIDFGVTAMLDGRDNLRRAGMLPVGSGSSAAEAFTPQLVEVNGWRVAVFAFAEFVEFESWYATPDRAGVANGKNLRAMTKAIRRFDPLVDVVVVSIHWGVERTFDLTSGQTNGAAALVSAGADVVFGHHPHRVQALRRVQDAPVFYSLGNFVWFHLGGAASDSTVGHVVFRRNGNVRACLLDARITRPGYVILEDGKHCVG